MSFRRPTRGWAGLVSRSPALGPLPADQDWIVAEPAEFRAAASYPWLAVLLFCAVIAGVGVVAAWSGGAGPSTTVVGAVTGPLGDATTLAVSAAILDVILAVLIIRCVRARVSPYRLLCRLALYEELWFRAGAERWTPRQRITGCLAFGVAHLANLVVSIVSLGMLAIAGAVFMVVYLHRLRRGDSRRAALVCAAKLHAQYNVCAFGLLALAAPLATATALATALGAG